MRIIAGALKGRKLSPVKGRTRPTAAKVREAIFDILGPAVIGVRVLDLFAGTGALGIEALSRGAAAAVFVEEHPEAVKALRRNLAELGLQAQSKVWPLPVAASLKKLAAPGERFGLAFLDPPYGGAATTAALQALGTGNLLAPQAAVVVEHSRRDTLPQASGLLQQIEVRRYGDTLVAFYVVQESAEQEQS